KLIDGIVKEPLGGAQADPFVASMELKKAIVDNVEELEKLKPEERINQRIDKFCAMGVYKE
ncbi:MAG: acetyl-CoA carboxylase carboxyl transferase subunit alpha, partial [Cyclobacteriaceae bacterium]|nr:acetyl-CoA carboxylase carboxyl transferase subunit alpha [Cyclobacteriaceae bacterium]